VELAQSQFAFDPGVAELDHAAASAILLLRLGRVHLLAETARVARAAAPVPPGSRLLPNPVPHLPDVAALVPGVPRSSPRRSFPKSQTHARVAFIAPPSSNRST